MIVNLDTRRTIAEAPVAVLSRWQQLLRFGAKRLRRMQYDAMVLQRRHTLFLGLAPCKLDIIFVDAEQVVRQLHRSVPPGKLMIRCPGADAIILLPRGIIAATHTRIGHRLNISLELTPAAIRQLLLPEPHI
nr:DUF192 domain-containing protein [Victivallis sp. Marseille-Q1083]